MDCRSATEQGSLQELGLAFARHADDVEVDGAG